ncbi:MAG: DUF6157 family protein [Actinomycetota bacterium]|nr:DUF6157 family protein [Actinomycetota bacterium]MDP9486197.1 DUF6157 family protein [Actinomycetota bacterium]
MHHEIRRKPYLRIESYNIRIKDLLKKLGWRLHADGEGKLAVYGCEAEEYGWLASSPTLRVVDAFKTCAFAHRGFAETPRSSPFRRS